MREVAVLAVAEEGRVRVSRLAFWGDWMVFWAEALP